MQERLSIILLNVKGEKNNFKEIFERIFSKIIINNDIVNSEGSYTATFFDDTTMKIEIANGDKRSTQLPGMLNLYSKIELPNKKLKESIMTQLKLINNMTYMSFEVSNENERTNSIINYIFTFAKETAAILLFPDLKIYTSNQKLLISPTGETDLEVYYPVSSIDYVVKEVILNDSDNARIEKNTEFLKANNIPYFKEMKLIPTEANTDLNVESDVLDELITSYIVATMASTLGGTKDEEQYNFIFNTLNKLYDIENLLTSPDKRVLEDIKNGTCTSADINNFSWEYETCAILLWALSLDEFPSQNKECNVDKMNELLFYAKDTSNIMDSLHLRAKEEILEKADLLNRYIWALDEARIKEFNIEYPLNYQIIRYQLRGLQRILNWK